MEFHEVANIFPLMEGAEYNELRDDIAANGLIEPIWTYDGKIIDGRNRYRACVDVGILPEYREYQGTESGLVAFVVSLNLKRRHLTSSQRAVVGLDVERVLGEQARERMLSGKRLDPSEVFQQGKSSEQAAEIVNTNMHYIHDAKRIAEASPDLLEKVRSGEMTIPEAKKELGAIERAEQRAKLAESAKALPASEKWNIFTGDIQTWNAPRQYDFIITDPPYPREFLYLYSILARRAAEWLKPGGLLIAMCGQSYLDVIYPMMVEHMQYYWTAAYLTPGQPTPLRQVNVNTTWKPLLIFSNGAYKGKIFGDVFTSDGNDKSFHKWGQSESGMLAVVKQICLPGQYILDPFCGAGTTGVAALRHGCLFDGLELDDLNAGICKARLYDAAKE